MRRSSRLPRAREGTQSLCCSYEHTNAICNILNGVPAPKLPPVLEEKLKAMFAEIQEPFQRNCPPQRKNFLSYGCVGESRFVCQIVGP